MVEILLLWLWQHVSERYGYITDDLVLMLTGSAQLTNAERRDCSMSTMASSFDRILGKFIPAAQSY